MRTFNITAFKVPVNPRERFFPRAKEIIETTLKEEKGFSYLVCDIDGALKVYDFISSILPEKKKVNLRSLSGKLDGMQMSAIALMHIVSAIEKVGVNNAFLFLDVHRIVNYRSALSLHAIGKKEHGKLYSDFYYITANILPEDRDRIKNSLHVTSYS